MGNIKCAISILSWVVFCIDANKNVNFDLSGTGLKVSIYKKTLHTYLKSTIIFRGSL